MGEKTAKLDTKEFEVPQTIFSREIETRVIQAIILYTLGKMEGVSISGAGLVDSLFGREMEKVKGVHVEQDNKTHGVKVNIEINIAYGISIPEKTEEVQNKIVQEIVKLTGLRVSSIHVVVKGLIPPNSSENKMLTHGGH